jgi:polyferredoxin
LHLAAIAYVVMESWLGIPCPLTVWEHQLRRAAGETVENISFIGYWLNYFLYYRAPDWVFTLVYSLFGALVVLTFVFYPPRFEAKRGRT